MNTLPDVVLLTEDLTDQGSQSAYLHLDELLKPLKVPLFVIPENHDNREERRKAFLKHSYMPLEGLCIMPLMIFRYV